MAFAELSDSQILASVRVYFLTYISVVITNISVMVTEGFVQRSVCKVDVNASALTVCLSSELVELQPVHAEHHRLRGTSFLSRFKDKCLSFLNVVQVEIKSVTLREEDSETKNTR